MICLKVYVFKKSQLLWRNQWRKQKQKVEKAKIIRMKTTDQVSINYDLVYINLYFNIIKFYNDNQFLKGTGVIFIIIKSFKKSTKSKSFGYKWRRGLITTSN